MKFIDAAFYISVDAVNQVLAHVGGDDFAYYIGGNIALHPWNPDDVIALRTPTRHGMGIYVTTVAGRSGAGDGSGAAALNGSYGARDGTKLCLDLEPGIFRADEPAALAYSVDWADAVRRAGFSPVLYSTPDGCAYIGDKGFDAVWAAVPGNPDPTTIFNPSFMTGNVAVQWGQDTWAGVEYDLSTSEFMFDPIALSSPPIGGSMATIDDVWGWITQNGDPLLRDIQKATEQGSGVTGNILEQILAALKAPTAVDVNALAASLATHPLTATLSDTERDAVATHVLQHLSKDTAAG